MTDLDPGLDFLVKKDDWQKTRLDPSPVPELAPGQVLFRVDRFALTANNITYMLVGDTVGYWRFFPGPEGWGRVPVMGFADVVRSTHPEVAEGTRCFGFYPMSRYLVIQPGAVSPGQIVDAAPHREGLAPAYAQYSPSSGDPLYRSEDEDLLMLLRGLFLTGYLAADMFADKGYFDATQVILSSASSKTAIALAHCLKQSGRVRVVGLTSARNLDFVAGLACYDEARLYDAATEVNGKVTSIYTDLSGDPALRRRIHTHFADRLTHSCGIGATHHDAGGAFAPETTPLPGASPEFFFAPAQILKRVKDWGPEAFQKNLSEAWAGFRDFAAGWVQVEQHRGAEATEQIYRATLAGETSPVVGNIAAL